MMISLAVVAAVLAAQHHAAPKLNPAITIQVDAAANLHGIDPRIYGVAFADAATLADLDLPINRWGGNTTSRYNWANSTSNHARDWFFENIPDSAPNGGANGESADAFIQPTLTNHAQAIITIPVLGYLPSSRTYAACGYSVTKYAASGCCANIDSPFHSDCGDGFNKNTGQPLKGINSPLDISTLYPSSHQGDWIQHNIDTFGSAATTGVKYYAIDNEPDLWDSTHFDIHPAYSSYDEIWGKTQEYGAVIKAKDPAALVSGFEISGWMGYFDSWQDWGNSSTADKTAHGGVDFVPWMLQQARTYEQQHGVRIIDFLSLHWYPQGSKATGAQEYNPGNTAEEITTTTKLLRNQSTRSLWDPAYVEQSWISDMGINNNIVRLIPLMHDWVNANYPGTKIGITEYNWGAENDPNGATAQAEILGIFGREALDLATRWTSPPAGSNVYNAYKMYRNYDGAHSHFGDTSVSAASPDADHVATFAALRSSDNALTIMIVAKALTDSTPVTINLANFSPAGTAHVWQLSSANAIAQLADIGAAATISLTVPAESVTLLVVPAAATLNPPAGVTAVASGATATVTWTAAAGAASYRIYRGTTIGGAFNPIGTTAGTTFPDSGLSADTTYLYKVQSLSGAVVSALSAPDAATTTVFTDDGLAAGTTVKAVHITQLRTAVNAMRVAAGLTPHVFPADVAPGSVIRATQLTDLRAALDEARLQIGLPAINYTDPTVTATLTPVKAAHVTQLRDGVR